MYACMHSRPQDRRLTWLLPLCVPLRVLPLPLQSCVGTPFPHCSPACASTRPHTAHTPWRARLGRRGGSRLCVTETAGGGRAGRRRQHGRALSTRPPAKQAASQYGGCVNTRQSTPALNASLSLHPSLPPCSTLPPSLPPSPHCSTSLPSPPTLPPCSTSLPSRPAPPPFPPSSLTSPSLPTCCLGKLHSRQDAAPHKAIEHDAQHVLLLEVAAQPGSSNSSSSGRTQQTDAARRRTKPSGEVRGALRLCRIVAV